MLGRKEADHHCEHSKHVDLSQAFTRRPGHSHQLNSCLAPPNLLSSLHAAQIRSCSCLLFVQQAAPFVSKCFPIAHNARQLVSLICKLPLLVKKKAPFQSTCLCKGLSSTYTALYIYVGEDKVNRIHLMLREADREVGTGPQDQHNLLHHAGSPAQFTCSCKAQLCSVVTLWHHQSQNVTILM